MLEPPGPRGAGAKGAVVISLGMAVRLAGIVSGELGPSCERLEVGGSIRRDADPVKDIELVAVPRYRPALFGDGQDFDELHECVASLVMLRKLAWRDKATRKPTRPPKTAEEPGRRFYPLVAVRSGVPLDLFVVRPPASWGVIMAIRTGNAAYSKALVVRARALGMRVEGGRLLVGEEGDEEVQTPDEHALFAALRIPCLAPVWRNDAAAAELIRRGGK